jgi:hypothetical protein
VGNTVVTSHKLYDVCCCYPLFYTYHFLLMQALLESHDVVAEKSYESSPQQEPQLPAFELPVNGMTADAIRMVGLRKSPNEPLVKFSIIYYLLNDVCIQWGCDRT